MKPLQSKASRRRFLRYAAGASVAAPLILPSGFLRGADAPSNKISLGMIGVGSMGSGHVGAYLNNKGARITAICDVDRSHNARPGSNRANDKGLDPQTARVNKHYATEDCLNFTDFRELVARDDIDAVVIATPDHWHALAGLEAIRSGKHVYCQKPITHLFREGQVLYKEAEAKGITFQTGSQQRSDVRFHRAVEIVQNGLLGKISKIEVGLPRGHGGPDGPYNLTTVPETQDYEMWTGPTQMLPYNGARNHWAWRWHTAYGGGQLMDWIGHHNDIAHWSMDLDEGGPTSVQATPDWEMCSHEVYDTPVHYTVNSEYADGSTINISSKNKMGITWHGENDQTLFVTRGTIECSTPEWLAESFNRGDIKPYRSKSHTNNFLEGIQEQKECICPAQTGHRSITPGHLGWLSHHMGGKKLEWDAATETITNDPAADTKLKEVDYRGEWKLEA